MFFSDLRMHMSAERNLNRFYAKCKQNSAFNEISSKTSRRPEINGDSRKYTADDMELMRELMKRRV